MATGRAAWTSIATASSGCRWRAAIWRASTGASARGRSTARRATGKHCPEGWTLYPLPGPQFQSVHGLGQRRGELLHLGGSARHLRLGPERADRHRQLADSLKRWWTASSSPCASLIRWAFTPRAWTAASTIRRRAGRAEELWSAYAGRATNHIEGGKGTKPKVVKFQLRPDPLAK